LQKHSIWQNNAVILQEKSHDFPHIMIYYDIVK
jgi:hypothetical protein